MSYSRCGRAWDDDGSSLPGCVVPYGLGAMPSGPWGTLVAKDGFRYSLSDSDVIWAARAAACEGGGEMGHKATLWTWTARFMLPNYRRSYRRLESLIRAHSQPVNPIWTRTGSKCRPGGSHATTDYCAESRLRQRERCATASWDSLPAHVKEMTLKWATARLPNPVPKAVDFASSSIGTQAGDIEVARYKSPRARHYNVFYSEAASRARPDDFVTIHHEGRVAGPGVSGGIPWRPIAGAAAVGAGVLFAGWAYWRYRRQA